MIITVTMDNNDARTYQDDFLEVSVEDKFLVIYAGFSNDPLAYFNIDHVREVQIDQYGGTRDEQDSEPTDSP